MTVMERDTELALVDRLRDGDPAAFDAVYEAYRARVFSFLARLARSREVAEDLAEEAWLRLVETAPRLRPDTRLGPWLFTVARNLYYSYCRSRATSDAAADALISLWPGGSPRPSPFEEAAARELEGRVERSLARLPANHREALLLVGVEGLTPAEAAGVCGLTPEAFRQRLSRARAALDSALARMPAGPVAPKLREEEVSRTAAKAEAEVPS
ncbi:MAG: RNA polymerase sigma factor [Vicinamibacterales bacterium]|jgi:RNA polymerase sigma-70 factor (ECF subfamily)|nr:RNA polymerase sigma factor [Vicinamibacterales bacterium]